MQKFTCGVKNNFNSGVIIDSDDRKKYEWNCSTCDMQGKTIAKEDLEDFKMSGKVMCPLLTYE
ncbi:MAG: hypothetical protein E3J52_06680 [Promethearchaeota archaeon]|nr:MAG: hypothetical protein E3J52_06680 [Candidatus Lokiarchaeota archaeon]